MSDLTTELRSSHPHTLNNAPTCIGAHTYKAHTFLYNYYTYMCMYPITCTCSCTLECAMLLCLVVCFTLLASFFLPSHLSLKHVHVLLYVYMYTVRPAMKRNEKAPAHPVWMLGGYRVQCRRESQKRGREEISTICTTSR